MSKVDKARSKRSATVVEEEEPAALPEIGADDDERDEADGEPPRGGKISFQGSMTRDEATAYFEAIAAGLRRGSLLFRRGSDQLALSPAPHVEVEVKASGKEHKAKVSFELSWSTQGPSDLEIS